MTTNRLLTRVLAMLALSSAGLVGTGTVLAVEHAASSGDPLDGVSWPVYGTADWSDGYQVVNRSDGTQLWIGASDFTGTFDAGAGDRIDVRAVGSDGIEQDAHQARCDDQGCARLVWTDAYTGGDPTAGAGEFVYEDVDF